MITRQSLALFQFLGRIVFGFVSTQFFIKTNASSTCLLFLIHLSSFLSCCVFLFLFAFCINTFHFINALVALNSSLVQNNWWNSSWQYLHITNKSDTFSLKIRLYDQWWIIKFLSLRHFSQSFHFLLKTYSLLSLHSLEFRYISYSFFIIV